MPIGQIMNVVIPSLHYQSSVKFYKQILGFTLVHEDELCCFVSTGNINISIHPANENTEFYPNGHCIYLDVVVSNIQEGKRYLLENNINIMKEWKDNNGSFLLIQDPDGNLIEITEFINRE
ncbi:MAG: VOC family protein [Heteroscytonema crispum UTEX LB 1556]